MDHGTRLSRDASRAPEADPAARRPSAPTRLDASPAGRTRQALAQLMRSGPVATARRAQLRSVFGPAAQLKAGPEEELRQQKVQPGANRTGLPDDLKSGVEALSGLSLDGVKVHYNSDRPAQLNARAYAQGDQIHLGPGQEQHLPHEAWHLVQQAQGRVKPTMQMKGGVPINDDEGLEREADRMGAKALQRRAVDGEVAGPSSAFAGSGDAVQLKSSKAVVGPGEFDAILYYPNPTDKDRDEIGASFNLKWRPDPTQVPDGTYGFVQKVKRQRLGVRPIKQPGLGPESLGADEGQILRDSKPKSQAHDFFKKISIKDGEQEHIDSLAEDYNKNEFRTNHPVYGSLGKQKSLSIDNSRMEAPANTVAIVEKGKLKTPASLDDKPFVYRYLTKDMESFRHVEAAKNPKAYEVFSRDDFEVHILGLSGSLQGKYLGGINWGWVKDDGGHREDPESITALPGSSPQPTPAFNKAAEKWNAGQANVTTKEKLGVAATTTLGGVALGGLAMVGASVGWPALVVGGGLGLLAGAYRAYDRKTDLIQLPVEKEKEKTS